MKGVLHRMAMGTPRSPRGPRLARGTLRASEQAGFAASLRIATVISGCCCSATLRVGLGTTRVGGTRAPRSTLSSRLRPRSTEPGGVYLRCCSDWRRHAGGGVGRWYAGSQSMPDVRRDTGRDALTRSEAWPLKRHDAKMKDEPHTPVDLEIARHDASRLIPYAPEQLTGNETMVSVLQLPGCRTRSNLASQCGRAGRRCMPTAGGRAGNGCRTMWKSASFLRRLLVQVCGRRRAAPVAAFARLDFALQRPRLARSLGPEHLGASAALGPRAPCPWSGCTAAIDQPLLPRALTVTTAHRGATASSLSSTVGAGGAEEGEVRASVLVVEDGAAAGLAP